MEQVSNTQPYSSRPYILIPYYLRLAPCSNWYVSSTSCRMFYSHHHSYYASKTCTYTDAAGRPVPAPRSLHSDRAVNATGATVPDVPNSLTLLLTTSVLRLTRQMSRLHGLARRHSLSHRSVRKEALSAILPQNVPGEDPALRTPALRWEARAIQ